MQHQCAHKQLNSRNMYTLFLSLCTLFFHGAHFFVMSTLAAFCMHFMSKSVLIRSVHTYGAHLSQKCLIVHLRETCFKTVSRRCTPCTLCTLYVFSVYTSYEHTVHTVHTMSTLCTRHRLSMHWLTMFLLFQDPVGSNSDPVPRAARPRAGPELELTRTRRVM